MTTAVEANADGLIGPTHSYAGLSPGNLASSLNEGQASNPRAAVLQGLEKMKRLADLGLPQFVLPPHERPDIGFLRSLGFAGSEARVLEQAWKDAPTFAAAACSASPMWAANAGPGAYFTYCNLNWGVIGTVMERVTGERFDRLMRRLLQGPMGLHGGFNVSELSPQDLANLATLYRKRTVDTEVWDGAGPWIAQVDDYSARPPNPPAGIDKYIIGANATPFSPTGGLRISAHDMGQVMLMLMNGGRHQGSRILAPASIDRMFARQWTYDGGNGDTSDGLFQSWGLGNQQFPEPQLVERGGFGGAGHLGDAYGLMSVFVFDAVTNNGMVALVGGTSADPAARKGRYSPLARFQERILSALYRRAILA